jgi:hypothetical protein
LNRSVLKYGGVKDQSTKPTVKIELPDHLLITYMLRSEGASSAITGLQNHINSSDLELILTHVEVINTLRIPFPLGSSDLARSDTSYRTSPVKDEEPWVAYLSASEEHGYSHPQPKQPPRFKITSISQPISSHCPHAEPSVPTPSKFQ